MKQRYLNKIAMIGCAAAILSFGLSVSVFAQDTSTTPPAAPDAIAPVTPDATPLSPSAMPMPAPVAIPASPPVMSAPSVFNPPELFDTMGTTLTTGPVDETLNYHLIGNTCFDDVDLAMVKTYHYSDDQEAKIYKIAKLSGMPMRAITQMVVRGDTFPVLCDKFGISYGELNDVSKEKEELAEYQAAAATIGKAGMKRHNVLGDQYNWPDSSAVVLAPPMATPSGM